MVTARKPTVLTPQAPRKAKVKAKAAPPEEWVPREGAPTWRSRPTRPGPWGDDEPPFYGSEAEVRERHQVDTEAGMAPVIEQLGRGLWGPPARPILTVAELAKRGMAQEHPSSGGTRWTITPEGYRLLGESMKARA